MRRLALKLGGLLLALSTSAHAIDPWQSVATVAEVTVRVHWVSSAELAAAARAVGRRAQRSPLGFSVLRQHTATGAFTCDIYLLQRPSRLQDKATGTLGHEMAHCLGFAHEQPGGSYLADDD